MYFKYLLALLVCLTNVLPTIGQTHINQRVKRESNCRTDDGKNGQCVRWNECRADLPNNYVFSICRTSFRGICCPITTDAKVTLTGLSIGFSDCLVDNEPGECIKLSDCESPPNRPKMCRSSVTNSRGICCPIKPGPTCGKDSKELPITSFVIGGKVANPGSWPWMVAIFIRKSSLSYHCGGAVIRNQFVITAAHCFDKVSDPRSYFVRIGGYDLTKDSTDDQNSEEMDIEEIIVHPSYQQGKFYSDIALLKLKRQIKQQDRKICLPGARGEEPNPSRRDEVYLAGWGLMQFGSSSSTGGTSSGLLREASLPIFITRWCDSGYRRELKDQFERLFHNGIEDDMFICAGSEGRTACEGDSGGPLMRKSKDGLWSVIGVVSSGSKYCGTGRLPALFTRVSRFENWIKQNTE